jgi:hypothetical protein
VTASRVMVMQRTIVTPAERERFLERARQVREHYRSRQCRYWVFEEAELPGAFIEFAESADAAALAAALAAAPEPIIDPARIYQEIEL